MSPSACLVLVLGLSMLVPRALARAPETPVLPSGRVTAAPTRPEPYLLRQGEKITLGDTLYFGGTTWAADSARWEAVPDSVWTFDTGVGSFLVQPGATYPGVDPHKHAGLHGAMEGWYGVDASHFDARPYARRVSSADPRWNGDPCVGAAGGLGGTYSFWAGAFAVETDSLCYLGGRGYGNSWNVCLSQEFGYAGGDVHLQFDLLLDSELDFDFLEVQCDTGGASPVLVASYSGQLAEPADFMLTPGSELPDSPGPVTLRFCFLSDGVWSDEDGVVTSTCGAFAIDDLALTGGITHTADFELGDNGWQVIEDETRLGGDWAHLAAMDDLPAIPDTLTTDCLLADSVLVLFDPELPPDRPHPLYQLNYAVSPWIDLRRAGVGPEYRGRLLLLDTFAALSFSELIEPFAEVQWYPDTCAVTGALQSGPWTGPTTGLVPIDPDPTCFSPVVTDFTNIIPAHAEQVRIGLKIQNLCRYFAFCSGTSNTTPWFDNVRFGAYRENSLQALIEAASPGDTIVVPAGTYRGSDGIVDLEFRGKSLFFWAPAGPESTIIDCEGLGRGLLFLQGEDSTCVVDGFTIRNGYAGTGTSDRGGGIYILGSTPRIRNCVIDSCLAYHGGGIYTNSPLDLKDTVVQDNEATGWGGGIYLTDSYEVRNVSVRRNRADRGGGIFMQSGTLDEVDCLENQARLGGGVALPGTMPGSSLLRQCLISGNTAEEDGGGIWGACVLQGSELLGNTAGHSGGGLFWTEGSALESRVSGNSAGADGGGVCVQTGTFSAKTFSITNSLVTGNRAGQSGGGIWAGGSAGWTVVLTGSTVTGNAAQDGGGMYGAATGQAHLTRTISWANAAGAQGRNLFLVSGSEVLTSCAAVDTLGAIGGPGTITHLGGLVDDDPIFCGAAPAALAPTTEGDYTLFVGSPCLPGVSPCDSLIGALGFGCTVVPVLPPPDDDDGDPPFLAAPGILAGPNPFTGELAIHYLSPSGTEPRVEIFAIDGRRVASYPVRSGSGTVLWRGEDAAGRRVASGVYLVRFTAGDLTVVRRVVKTH